MKKKQEIVDSMGHDRGLHSFRNTRNDFHIERLTTFKVSEKTYGQIPKKTAKRADGKTERRPRPRGQEIRQLSLKA